MATYGVVLAPALNEDFFKIRTSPAGGGLALVAIENSYYSESQRSWVLATLAVTDLPVTSSSNPINLFAQIFVGGIVAGMPPAMMDGTERQLRCLLELERLRSIS